MKVYNIKSVSRITGLTAFVIRAWEKRYNVVTPTRTETNRRIYSEEDIEKLRLLKKAVDQGNSIGSIADLPVSELKDLLKPEDQPVSHSKDPQQDPEEYLIKCLNAVKAYDYHNLEKHLMRSSIEFSNSVVIDEIVLPLLREIGTQWHQGTIRVAQEHMASAVIRTFLYNLKDAYKPIPGAPKIIFTTPVGQHHEFGALAASLIASLEGWEAIYLGPDLPSSEIIAAAVQLNPAVVALSIAYYSDDINIIRELQNLQHLPENIKLIAGGRGSSLFKNIIENYGGIVMTDLNAFRNFLQTFSR